MTKVTNTGAAPLYLGTVQIPPHATMEVSDDVIAKAKEAKIVEEWFANGTLKTGDTAAAEEFEKLHPKPPAGTAASTKVVDEDDLPPKQK